MSERRKTWLRLPDGREVEAWQDGSEFYDAEKGGKRIDTKAAPGAVEE